MKSLEILIYLITGFNGVSSWEIVNYNMVYDRIYDNYQINFINDWDGIYEYGHEQIKFVTDPLSDVFITMSKYINENVIGHGWQGWKIPHNIYKNIIFNSYSVDDLKNLLKSLINKPNVSVVDQCDQQSSFVLDSNLLNAIFQGNLAVRYILVVFAVWDLIVVIKKYDEYTDKILRVYDKLENNNNDPLTYKIKDLREKIMDKVAINNTSLKDFLKMPRFISLLFSNSFFLFFKSNNEVERLIALDDKYTLWKKIFTSKKSNFFYDYCYDLWKIFVRLPVILSSIIINVNLLQEQYSNNLLVLISFSLLSLFLSLCSPCIIQGFEKEPKVYLVQFWLSLFKLVLLSVIMGWFLE